MEKINLFPTTIGKFNLIDYADWVAKRYEHHMFERGQTGEIDGKVLVHLDPQMNSFMLEVNDCIDEYLCSMNVRYDIHFMKTWYAVSGEDSSVPNHCHDPAHISWVYYLDTQDPLTFTKDSQNEWFPQAFADAEKNFFNTSVWEENTKEGDLLIFPANLKHMTYNTGHRWSVAGDVLLTNPDLNKEGGLTHPQYWKQF